MLLGIIGAIGSQMLDGGFSAYFASRDAEEADWQGHIALERMARDILRLRSSAPADLIITSTSQLTLTEYDGTAVSYGLSGNSLMRNGTPLADGVSGLTFGYLQSDGATAATQSTDVYYIAVNFTVTRNAVSRSWSTMLHPRNLR